MLFNSIKVKNNSGNINQNISSNINIGKSLFITLIILIIITLLLAFNIIDIPTFIDFLKKLNN